MNTLILLPALLALYLPCSLSQSSLAFNNPCFRIDCQIGFECRLQKVQCFRAPCYPTGVCRPLSGSQNQCPIGKPIIDANGRDLACTYGCPDGTSCQGWRFGTKCCLGESHEQVPTKPGVCPSPYRAGCGAPCNQDGDCPGTSKCCSTRACRGRRCINPIRPCPFYNPRCGNTNIY